MHISKTQNNSFKIKNVFLILAVLLSFSFTHSQIPEGDHAKVLEPSGDEIFKVGDTIHIQFLADASFSDYDIKISVDSGKTFGFQYIDTNYYYKPTDPDFKDKAWVIPETLTVNRSGRISKIYMVSEHVVLQLDDLYNKDPKKYNSGVFAIVPKSPDRIEGKIQPAFQTGFNVRIEDNVLFSSRPVELVKVVDIMGRTVASFNGNANLKIDIKSNLKTGIAAGVYKISVQSVKGETSVVNWVFAR